MTLWDFANGDFTSDKKFRIGKSKIVWESATPRCNGVVVISRICKQDEKGGKSFLMGLRYKSRRASGNEIIHIV